MKEPLPKFALGGRVRTNNGKIGTVAKVEKRSTWYSCFVNGIGPTGVWINEGALRKAVEPK